jgi:hypothetical protein
MKTIASTVAAAVMICTAMFQSFTANAADVALEGYGYYELGSRANYYRYGTTQSGRYSNFGAGYYRNGEIGVDEVANNSSSRSGSLSFELWALSYYGATRGTVLMTRVFDPLWGGYSYTDVASFGQARSLNRYRYPELNLYEYTRYGWKWRDALSFSFRDLM